MVEMMKTLKTIILVLVLTFGIVCFEAWLGMLLFNWVVGLFGCTFILTFWQTFGICILLDFVGSFFRTKSKNN